MVKQMLKSYSRYLNKAKRRLKLAKQILKAKQHRITCELWSHITTLSDWEKKQSENVILCVYWETRQLFDSYVLLWPFHISDICRCTCFIFVVVFYTCCASDLWNRFRDYKFEESSSQLLLCIRTTNLGSAQKMIDQIVTIL